MVGLEVLTLDYVQSASGLALGILVDAHGSIALNEDHGSAH
jgi:hypothetical protein